MNVTELLKHPKCGIDFDDTLIGHDRSHILQQFILDNQGSIEFHIVTHRTHGLVDRIESDLLASTLQTGVPLMLAHFHGIHCVPRELFEGHYQLHLTIAAMREAHRLYYGWKAIRCQEIGCTVLIDDHSPDLGEYCAPLGIICLHPDHY